MPKEGWPREPARHRLAAMGIKTGKALRKKLLKSRTCNNYILPNEKNRINEMFKELENYQHKTGWKWDDDPIYGEPPTEAARKDQVEWEGPNFAGMQDELLDVMDKIEERVVKNYPEFSDDDDLWESVHGGPDYGWGAPFEHKKELIAFLGADIVDKIHKIEWFVENSQKSG